jgi:hypothetical protein
MENISEHLSIQEEHSFCKCGNPVVEYGKGNFSKSCAVCNEKKARQSRESRARCKANELIRSVG